MKLFLLLLSIDYLIITYIRNKLYDFGILKSYKSKLKVVCVGNLTVGGNGKTPLSAYLFKQLSKSNKPVILTRGYKSKIKSPCLVKCDDFAHIVGDEPLMLTKFFNAKVVVSPSRIKGAKFIEKEKLGDLIILDDGFQHRRLKTDFNIIAVNLDENTYQQYKKPYLLPFGRFRESFIHAKKRVDAFVLINRSTVCKNFKREKLFSLFGEEKTFFANLRQEEVVSLNSLLNGEDEREVNLDDNFVVLTGLANPEGFISSASNLVNVEKSFSFSDHYLFKKDDLVKISKDFPNAKMLCTLKDAVKINPEWGFSVYVLKTNLQINEYKKLMFLYKKN